MNRPVKRNILSAFLLSLLIPFSGLIYTHKPLRALLCASITLLIFALESMVSIFSTWKGCAVSLTVLGFVWLYSIIASLRAAQRGLSREEACHDIGPWIVAWALAVILSIVVTIPFPYRTYDMSSLRMLPTIREGEYLVGRLLAVGGRDKGMPPEMLQPGDIVAILDSNGVQRLRRLTGLPGDLLEIRDEKLWRNSEAIRSAENLHLPGYTAAWRIPADTYYVLEDNGNPPHDTTTVFLREDIVAKILYVLWSADRNRIGISF